MFCYISFHSYRIVWSRYRVAISGPTSLTADDIHIRFTKVYWELWLYSDQDVVLPLSKCHLIDWSISHQPSQEVKGQRKYVNTLKGTLAIATVPAVFYNRQSTQCRYIINYIV